MEDSEAEDLEADNLAASEPLIPKHGPHSGGDGDATTIAIKGANFFVGVDETREQILFEVSASFHPGTATAIMGPSGAGKTTLLNCICGHATHGTVEPVDAICENGATLVPADFRNRLSYVPQDECLWSVLTAEELLTYVAKLRFRCYASGGGALDTLQYCVGYDDRVEAVLKTVGMWERKDVVIGSALEGGLSGGQRKRVSIAMELIADRPVLLLDEPTSGLDSCTAGEVPTSSCDFLTDPVVPDLQTAG